MVKHGSLSFEQIFEENPAENLHIVHVRKWFLHLKKHFTIIWIQQKSEVDRWIFIRERCLKYAWWNIKRMSGIDEYGFLNKLKRIKTLKKNREI